MKLNLIPVQIGNGLVVMHTPEEYARLIAGVDLEAARLASSSVPIELDPKEPQLPSHRSCASS